MCGDGGGDMRRRGMTLVELTVVMVLSAILLLAMTSQFLANQNVQAAIANQLFAVQEAEVALTHMTRVLRFAVPSPAPVINGDLGSYPGGSTIQATIEGAAAGQDKYHLPEFTSDTQVEYAQDSGHDLYCIIGTGAPVLIAKGVTLTTTLNSSGFSADHNFTITVLAQKGNRSITLNTAIHSLPI